MLSGLYFASTILQKGSRKAFTMNFTDLDTLSRTAQNDSRLFSLWDRFYQFSV